MTQPLLMPHYTIDGALQIGSALISIGLRMFAVMDNKCLGEHVVRSRQ
jgi:hypothetical protein